MKKLLLCLAFLGFTAIAANAQSAKSDGGKFSIGVDAGLPVGDSHKVSNFAIGGSLKYDHPIADQLFLTGSAGYTRFLYKSEIKDFIGKSGAGFIPVKAGLKYYFDDAFFAEGQLGAVFSTESGGGTGFAYAPGIGYSFAGGLEAGVRYEGWSKDGTTSQVALRVAFRF
ncbi:outer membrane beta-barrel protein [Mucilaginibacter sp. CAU 1740]|uniref:outer membrane beta-barrel protein n=1 Tax=Mucilaginibacter sp. CAU 1740 TaxID=3140365 RepID=UPI00325B10E8